MSQIVLILRYHQKQFYYGILVETIWDKVHTWNISKNSINYGVQYNFSCGKLQYCNEVFSQSCSLFLHLHQYPHLSDLYWRPRKAPERDLSPVWVSALLYLHLITPPPNTANYTALLTSREKIRDENWTLFLCLILFEEVVLNEEGSSFSWDCLIGLKAISFSGFLREHTTK